MIGEEWRVSPPCRNTSFTVAQCKSEAALDERSERFDECCFVMPGALNRQPSVERVAVFHYATKSWQDFAAKMKRGSGMSRSAKKEDYFTSLAKCASSSSAVELWWLRKRCLLQSAKDCQRTIMHSTGRTTAAIHIHCGCCRKQTHEPMCKEAAVLWHACCSPESARKAKQSRLAASLDMELRRFW